MFIEKKIREKKKGVQRSCDRCKGEGRGGSSQRSYDRWGAGGARQARHSEPVRPVQYKARGLIASLKKIKFSARPGPLTGQRAYRPGPNRAAGLTCSGRPGPLKTPKCRSTNQDRISVALNRTGVS